MAIRVKKEKDLSCAEFWHQQGVRERGGEYFLDAETGTVRLVKMQGKQLLLDL